ncbi:hypothetical protein BDZ89DRAFT_1004236 [Hymenopellis radicata]|nr:hypothetical protein BDZ89DRAFT_1004236 [Hymenopellis radicata]
MVTPSDAARTERAVHRCEVNKKYLLTYSPTVTFLLHHLNLSGCKVPERNLVCAPCTRFMAGGYVPGRGAVVLCANNFYSRDHLERTMCHELMHLYDECRFKVDWANLRHQACSEIRANNLSGDCRYFSELRRGIVSFAAQHQECVRRRAIESVTQNPNCPNEETARKVVNEVWESCFKDTRPFDEIF